MARRGHGLPHVTATVLPLVACALILAGAGPAEPAFFGVNTTDDPGDGTCTGEHCTLREAIAAAAPGDEIRFSWSLMGSTIVLGHDAGPLVIDKDLTINCLLGADNLAVSGDHRNTVLQVLSGVVVVSGLTIRDGLGVDVSGILNQGHLTLSECRLTGNDADGIDTSGAIKNSGHLTLDRSHLNSNTSFYDISAVSNRSGATLEIRDSSVASNGGMMGGPPIENLSGGQATILRSSITGNWNVEGGGAGFGNSGLAEVRDSIVAGNSAYEGTGGIANGGTLLLVDSAVINNHCSGYAVACGIENWGDLTMINVTVSGNRGAGLISAGAATHAHVVNSTVTNNSHGTPYPDLSCTSGVGATYGASVELENSIVAGNSYFGDPHHPNADCCGPATSLGGNLVGLATGCPVLPGDLTVDADDVFVSVLEQASADHGGLTQTHALLPGSPAIDSAAPVACPATDQRGFPRPFDGDGDLVPVCDVGAYEHAPDLLFFDGFESCGCGLWSSSRP